ncbi:MAG TPA: DUF1549 domain-containing protein [Pirellulales bacterium]|nr:DUF1549 domain-containing protein [Pirellulales bacterium]
MRLQLCHERAEGSHRAMERPSTKFVEPGRRRLSYWTAAALATLLIGPPAFSRAAEAVLEPIVVGTPERIEVYPPQVKLASTRARMQLVVTGFYAGGGVQDLTRAAQFLSTNEQVAKLAGSAVLPAANGQAEVLVHVAGQEVKVPVEVAGQETVERVSFNYGTLAALSKQGCNQGACHGSPSGKGGFRMSLRAYDAALDQVTLVREAYGRRTNMFEPEKSLLLQKPLMEVAHGGGQRLRKSDPSYELLRDWIAQGCQFDPADAPSCVKVDVYPRQRILHRPAHTQQIHVLAHFSDGSVRDITQLASFSSSDEAVASVDATGLVVGNDRGEAAILVRFLDKIETAYMMFLKDVPGFAWNNPPESNYVDKFVFEKLKQLQILPSDVCTDEEFVRRVFLDVIGELPSVAESQAFLADTDPQKRAKLIDGLLERPEFADFWALKWADLLRLRNNKVTVTGVPKFHHWVMNAWRKNMPYDEFARELLMADGSTFDNPPANYFRTATDTNDCTETTSQLFLGIRIQCAKCHNHPFERWTQDNYYGIGAFFNRVQRKQSARPEELVVWIARGGEVTQPRTGKQMKPWLPLSGDAELPGETDRRQALVEWLVRPDNPFFAKVEVNRLWGHLLGRGIVEPVDDFRDSNPPASASLLDALAKDFVEHRFDRKYILRTILNSRTYQLSSRKNEFNQSDVKYFSHARTRLLSAEQLLDAICQVTSVAEKFAGMPLGTRATQLPSPDVDNYFLKVFGQPARETACQCERSSDSNLSQALQMINGPLVHGKVRDENNRFRQLLKTGKTNEEIITELYLAAFARKPSEHEMSIAVNHIATSGDQVRGLEDVCWALLNANEFLFQH